MGVFVLSGKVTHRGSKVFSPSGVILGADINRVDINRVDIRGVHINRVDINGADINGVGRY